MMHIFINALGASSSSGLTYLRNVIPHFSRHAAVCATIAVNPSLRQGFQNRPGVSVLPIEWPSNSARRFWMEQTALPGLINRVGADVLLSTGNFALWRSPVPQILLSGNSLYLSPDFLKDLRARRQYAMWLDTRIKGWFAKRSLKWADVTIAPSQSFARDLGEWADVEVAALHHGFDREIFRDCHTVLSAEVQQYLESSGDALRLLFVSHYNYYRNFETLFRALPIIKERVAPRQVRLFLTCKLREGENPGSYRTGHATAMVERLGISSEVVELGAIPYQHLHHVYESSDIYVTPAYAETFAHPVVEAMACGLPIVASDLGVHREICGTAAVFFPTFSPEKLADQVVRVVNSSDLRHELSKGGLERSQTFSWARHVSELVRMAESLAKTHEEALPGTNSCPGEQVSAQLYAASAIRR